MRFRARGLVHIVVCSVLFVGAMKGADDDDFDFDFGPDEVSAAPATPHSPYSSTPVTPAASPAPVQPAAIFPPAQPFTPAQQATAPTSAAPTIISPPTAMPQVAPQPQAPVSMPSTFSAPSAVQPSVQPMVGAPITPQQPVQSTMTTLSSTPPAMQPTMQTTPSFSGTPTSGAPSVQPAPQPVAQPTVSPAAAQAPQEIKTEGITTAQLQEPSGNWLAKRGWWEKAQDLYGKIRRLTDQVFEHRIAFFNRRTELDRTLFDPFYIHAGLSRGELEELLNYLMAQVEEQKTKQGMLTEQERAFLEIMTKQKQTLDQLKLDVAAITKLDNTVDDALSKLMEQLSLARNYEQQAWESFKTIAEVLNDKKARELYYAMVTNEENINAINNYIKRDLTSYFDQLAKTATENIGRIQGSLQALKEKGIDFKKKAKELEEKDTVAARERRQREIDEKEEQEAAEAQARTWSGWFKNIVSSVWGSITGVFSSVYNTVTGWFVSSAAVDEGEDEEPVRPAAKPAPQPAAATTTLPNMSLRSLSQPQSGPQAPVAAQESGAGTVQN